MAFTQISRREGRIERVPEGEEPVIELDLEPHQYVVSASLTPLWPGASSKRTTVDWVWTVYVVNNLGTPDFEQDALLSSVENSLRPCLA